MPPCPASGRFIPEKDIPNETPHPCRRRRHSCHCRQHSALAAEKTIVVGVTAGPHAEIMEVVKRIAEKQGMKIRIVEFNDFVQPNAALVAGDLDINSFQHKPYMDQQNEDRGYKLASAAPTITFPLTYYTRKGYKTLADLPQGARVGIPNDPTNANRALHMLEEQGLVRLNPKAGIRATVLDIIDNVKKLRIIELDSAQLPRAQERPDGPYANILCVRAEDLSKPWVAKFVQCYHSPEVKAFVEKRFNGGMICAW